MTNTNTGHSTGQLDARPGVLTEHNLAALAEILAMVEEFLRTAGANVHAELRGYLRSQQPPADPGWLIDMLGFHTLHLQHQLEHQPSAPAPSPRQNRQPRDQHNNSATDGEVAW